MHRFLCVPVLVASALLLSACHGPRASAPMPARAVVALPQTVVAEPVLPPGVYISPVQQGDADVAFTHTREFKQTFPPNQIGANLAFTANLRMPKLEAIGLPEGGYQLHMRFSNTTTETLIVSLICTYEGETRAERVIRAVEFPVNSFRDIVMDMEGDPGRKLNIHANAAPALEVGALAVGGRAR